MDQKSQFVIDFEEKTAEDLADNEVLVYGNAETVKGVTLEVDVSSRADVSEVLAKTSDLICGGSFLAQVPHSENGGIVKFYFPGNMELKERFTTLSAALGNVSFELNPRLTRVGTYSAADTIDVEELFVEPQPTNTDLG